MKKPNKVQAAMMMAAGCLLMVGAIAGIYYIPEVWHFWAGRYGVHPPRAFSHGSSGATLWHAIVVTGCSMAVNVLGCGGAGAVLYEGGRKRWHEPKEAGQQLQEPAGN